MSKTLIGYPAVFSKNGVDPTSTVETQVMSNTGCSETCKCKWCGATTPNTGTKECDRCWELRSRIERDPDIAMEIFLALHLHVR